MSGADPNNLLDPHQVELMRDYPSRAGWLETELTSARDAMVRALDVVKRSRSWDGKRAARELEFRIGSTNRTLALVEAANAERDAEIAELDAEIAEQRARRAPTGGGCDDA